MFTLSKISPKLDFFFPKGEKYSLRKKRYLVTPFLPLTAMLLSEEAKEINRNFANCNTAKLSSRVDHVSPTIYLGGGHDFLSEIGLFRQLAGTALFASRVKSGSTIELGENVQLRSIVRAGDGKRLQYLVECRIIIHRLYKMGFRLELCATDRRRRAPRAQRGADDGRAEHGAPRLLGRLPQPGVPRARPVQPLARRLQRPHQQATTARTSLLSGNFIL